MVRFVFSISMALISVGCGNSQQSAETLGAQNSATKKSPLDGVWVEQCAEDAPNFASVKLTFKGDIAIAQTMFFSDKNCTTVSGKETSTNQNRIKRIREEKLPQGLAGKLFKVEFEAKENDQPIIRYILLKKDSKNNSQMCADFEATGKFTKSCLQELKK